jgi:coenzyme F420-0:L-glutamate ligase/coenzyme F420-1:gamma-L-glutamate ligase
MRHNTHSSLILTPLPGIPLIQAGDDLARIILTNLTNSGITLKDGDILVIAQKIVSKAEGRRVKLDSISPSNKAQELHALTGKDPRLLELILQESNQVLRTRHELVIVEHRLGFVCANAGIDQSNINNKEGAGGWVLLLPDDPDDSAERIRTSLENSSGVQLGVLIIDSHGRAWRMGVTGVAIGIAGLPGLVDMRGQPDLFGHKLRVTEVGAADELAAAASLIMGQSDEGRPVVHVRGFPYPLREAKLSELLRPKDLDLFR